MVKRAHLRALLHALSVATHHDGRDDGVQHTSIPTPHAPVAAFLGPPLTPVLVKVVSDGLTKATGRSDGLTALMTLTLAAVHAPVAAVLEKDQVCVMCGNVSSSWRWVTLICCVSCSHLCICTIGMTSYLPGMGASNCT